MGKDDAAAMPGRVLVVDDDDLIRTSMELLLGEKFDVTLASTAEEAIERVDVETDVVLLDVRLGTSDGFAVARALRDRAPETLVIFHTAYPMPMSPEQLINEYHPFGYLTKDGELERLMKLVEEAVGLRRLRKAEARLADAGA